MIGKLGLKLFVAGLFATIVLYHFLPNVWVLPWVPLACLGLLGVGFVLWIIFSIEWVIRWFQKRSSQFGISVVLSAIGVIAILAVLNWAAVEKNKKWDLTRNKLHSLSEQSIKIMQGLKEDVVLDVWTANIKEMSGTTDMARFLDNYVQASNGKLKVKIHNPNAERLEAIQAKITRKDVIIAHAASGRESRVDNFNNGRAEEQITNAVVQVIKGRKKMACFLNGHGEIPSATSDQGPSISQLKESLESSSYSVREITLATEKVMPAECELLVSVGPKSAPSDNEIKLLGEYLAQGGKLIAMWGLETPQVWQKVLDPYGVTIDNNILIDERVQGAPGVYTKTFASDSEITRNFNSPLFMILSRSISLPKAPAAGVTTKALASTEEGTLQKAGDIKSLKAGAVSRASLGKAVGLPVVVEIRQTVTKADDKPVAAGETKPAARETGILVFGNNMMASNGLITQFGNLDFLMNSVSYLMKDTDLIGIRPKDIKAAKLDLTPASLRQVQGYLLLSTLLFIMLAVYLGFGRRVNIPA